MYKIIELDTLESVIQIISEQEYGTDTKRHRSSFVYHGLSNSSFELVNSLRRNCKHLSANLELSILRNFSKYALAEYPSTDFPYGSR